MSGPAVITSCWQPYVWCMERPAPTNVRELAQRRFADATARHDHHQRHAQLAAAERAEAVALLHDSGLSFKEIGVLLNISAPRVGQLLGKLHRS
jgi:hypothetical protein